MQFTGCGTALVTPFCRDRSLDEKTLRSLVRRQIDAGVHFLVPCGTTGESPALTREEHLRVVEITIQECGGRLPVLAGAGGYNTAEVMEFVGAIAKLGADGILSVTPYYNKPTQEGYYRHFAAVAEAVDLPIILYNIPGRTGSNILPETIARLAEIPTIVGIKEATGSMDQASQVAALCNLTILSGDDSLTLPLLSIGGQGVVSVVGNIVPRDMKALITAFEAGRLSEAQEWHRRLFPLCRDMLGVATNPIPIKAAMQLLGRAPGELRLPLCALDGAGEERVLSTLQQYGLTRGAQ